MNQHDVIVIGASAGGVETLMKLAAGLPGSLPSAVFIVLHVPSSGNSILPTILDRAGELRASHAVDGEIPHPGHIYIAPPNSHMILAANEDGKESVRLIHGPREHGHRPAIDPLFRSAAFLCGQRVVGVVLTGNLADGSNGLHEISRNGGVTIVQDPEEAIFPGMPLNAIDKTKVDYILPSADIAAMLIKLTHDSSKNPTGGIMSGKRNNADEQEALIISQSKRMIEAGVRANIPTLFTCPNCGGVLWELVEGDQLVYRCQVGHRYSATSLIDEQANALEQALWEGLRALEERAALARRMVHRAQENHYDSLVRRYEKIAGEAEQNATLIRNVMGAYPGN